jgi:hypothetical protein
MLRIRLLTAALAALALLLPAVTRPAEKQPFRYPAGEHQGAKLASVNGLPVLTVAGTPEEIGEQIAVLAGKPALRLFDYPKDAMREHGGEAFWPRMVTVGRRMLRNFPPEYLREMEAFGRAGNFDRDSLIAANTMFDIYKVFACSSLIVDGERTTTGGPLLGRNLDFPTLGYLHEYTLVTVYRPKGKHAWVSVGFPGIIGCISGMNDQGLCVAVLEVYEANDGSPRFDPAGVPYALCYRTLLEECATVDEAYNRLKAMKRTTMTNLAVCDRNGGAVFEVTPRTVVLRKPQECLCLSTNHFVSAELAPPNPENNFYTLDRYATLAKANGVKKLGLADIQARLHAANLGDFTIQTMIFEPAVLKLHLAHGKCPASAQPLKTLDLKPYFAKKCD